MLNQPVDAQQKIVLFRFHPPARGLHKAMCRHCTQTAGLSKGMWETSIAYLYPFHAHCMAASTACCRATDSTTQPRSSGSASTFTKFQASSRRQHTWKSPTQGGQSSTLQIRPDAGSKLTGVFRAGLRVLRRSRPSGNARELINHDTGRSGVCDAVASVHSCLLCMLRVSRRSRLFANSRCCVLSSPVSAVLDAGASQISPKRQRTRVDKS